jgi:hypothetical protein
MAKRQDMMNSQLCRFFYKALSGEAKSCNKGDRCSFAHTPQALCAKSRPVVSTGNNDRRAGERVKAIVTTIAMSAAMTPAK